MYISINNNNPYSYGNTSDYTPEKKDFSMIGPTKNLTILSCESQSLGPNSENSSFKIAKHAGIMKNILAQMDGNSGEVKYYLEGEAFELPSEFLHSDDSVEQKVSCIRSFVIIEGDWLAILILGDGRIYRSSVDEFAVESFTFEQVGAVEGGISAAEWSPDYNILVLITGLNRRILLSRDFEAIEEGPVQVEDFGSEEMISIGWGRKETQFHGTLGKSAAIAVAQVKMEVVDGDNRDARVSWRADGSYFAVSSVDSGAGRRIRVYDRTGHLLSTSEPIEGLEGPLAWRPNGSVIASTQFLKAQNKRQVIFFERNGLRHGEFVLPEGHWKSVKDMAWSADSHVLAVQYQTSDEVELWASSNYHWYLKKAIPVGGGVKMVSWDQERMTLNAVVNDHWYSFKLVWDQIVDDSCVLVVDGKTIHLTPLNISNIPPPMSLFQLNVESVPDAVTLKACGDCKFAVAVALPKKLEIYNVSLSTKRSACTFELVKTFELTERIIQIEPTTSGFIALNLAGTEICTVNEELQSIPLPEKCTRVLSNCGHLLLTDSTVHRINNGELEFVGCLENKGEWAAYLENENVHLVMNEKGWMWANDRLIMTQATSFALTDQFILITTHTHQLVFLPRGSSSVDSWESLARAALEGQNGNEELQRRVERGALLVSAVPEASGVVLQMPRGNLETVNPRAMVLASLRQHLNALEYRAAYALCRRHRIDLNILHDHAPELFMQTIGKFVKDLESVDHLNIFLSSLRDEDVSKTKYAGFTQNTKLSNASSFEGKINSVSEAVLKVLQEDSLNWIDSIMTVYVVQQPPRLESALNCIIELANCGKEAEIIEKSVKYLLFLVPAEKLFDVALGMYQLPLALSIGRRSQKDPKDFEPFLEELASLPELRRKFKINDHFQRFPEALECLKDEQEEFLVYTQKYQLYKAAISIASESPKLYRNVLNLFGVNLAAGGEHFSAVCCFKRAGNWTKVIESALICGAWMEFLAAQKRLNSNFVCNLETAKQMISALKANGQKDKIVQFCKYAGVSNEFTFKFAIEAGLFAEAACLYDIKAEQQQELFEALNSHGKALESRLKELSADFNGKKERILRIQKEFLTGTTKPINPNASTTGSDVSDNVSEMSFKTSNTTIKTRTTNASRRSTTSSKKTDRNRTRDRPGSPHEREFLLFNIRDLIGQIYKLAGEVKETCKNLVEFGDDQSLSLPRSISNSYSSLCASVGSFVDDFRRIQVPKIETFNSNGQAVNDQGILIENPLIDPLDAKFELPADFGAPATWSLKLF